MRNLWLLIGGSVVVLVGIAGLVLPVIPGIALIVGGAIMIRAGATGRPMEFPEFRRTRAKPLPDPTDS